MPSESFMVEPVIITIVAVACLLMYQSVCTSPVLSHSLLSASWMALLVHTDEAELGPKP